MAPSNRINDNSVVQTGGGGGGGGGGHDEGQQDWRRSSHPPSVVARTITGSAATAALRSAVPCFVFLLVYGLNDRIRILPRASDVHCVALYNVSAVEAALLPFALHRAVSSVQHPVLDVLAALPYLLHYLIPVAFPVYLYAVRRSDRVPHFFRLLGCSMWTHYVIWFVIPTAPPWAFDGRVQLAVQHPTTVPSTELHHPLVDGDPPGLQHREGCAFARLDQWTGVPFFYTIFNGNPVPFASFPSGHVAWPMCVMLSLPAGTGSRSLFVLYIVWVSWATMYSCHHYLLDILAAIVITLLCQLFVNSGKSCCCCCCRLSGCGRKSNFTRCYLTEIAIAH